MRRDVVASPMSTHYYSPFYLTMDLEGGYEPPKPILQCRMGVTSNLGEEPSDGRVKCHVRRFLSTGLAGRICSVRFSSLKRETKCKLPLYSDL